MSFKKGRLSAAEKEAISSKSGDLASLKRVAKKLNRSLDTVQKYLDTVAVVETVEANDVPKQVSEITNAFGEKSTRKESGVVVATAQSSSRVDSVNKKMKSSTVEQILESKPDCTARIR